MRRAPTPFGLGLAFTFFGGAAILLAYHQIVLSLFDATPTDVYYLLPLFVLLGVLAAVLYRLLAAPMDFPRQGLGFVMGCLAGGSLSAFLGLFMSAAERPLLNRLAIAVFGAVLLGGFFPWIGALLMHARRQDTDTA